MPAYLIARVEVTDPDQYAKYTALTPGIIAKFGGKFIVRAGHTVTLEGPEEKRRVVVIEFPDRKTALAFYNSSEYQSAKKLREHAAIGEFIAIEGVVGQ